ncbi:MAG TPA: L-histidine N(alpha)-methyltransferase, partial [Anaeromyxobacter sp.]|nr:L-histidine N(alpha)-methyltransferase [Anaeromyxobacter sp.]
MIEPGSALERAEGPGTARFLEEAVAGLSAARKAMSPKWLYDEAGSQIYERITEVPEYYPTRTEIALLEARATE